MFSVALIVAHKLRAGWRAWAALAVIVAIAGGRWAWQLFASQAGLGTGAVTPPSLFLMIPVTAGAAILVALPAARSCARLRAAATLRSE